MEIWVCVCVRERECFVVFAFNIIMAIGNSFPPVITFYLSYLWLFCTFFFKVLFPQEIKKAYEILTLVDPNSDHLIKMLIIISTLSCINQLSIIYTMDLTN